MSERVITGHMRYGYSRREDYVFHQVLLDPDSAIFHIQGEPYSQKGSIYVSERPTILNYFESVGTIPYTFMGSWLSTEHVEEFTQIGISNVTNKLTGKRHRTHQEITLFLQTLNTKHISFARSLTYENESDLERYELLAFGSREGVTIKPLEHSIRNHASNENLEHEIALIFREYMFR